MDWRTIQSLVRLMPDLHKTLLLVNLRRNIPHGPWEVEELAMTSEHAPFRHKHTERKRKAMEAPGRQTKVPSQR